MSRPRARIIQALYLVASLMLLMYTIGAPLWDGG